MNMRPNAPVAQNKTVATVSPRVVINNPHMVATRPTNPGVSVKNNDFFSLVITNFDFYFLIILMHIYTYTNNGKYNVECFVCRIRLL